MLLKDTARKSSDSQRFTKNFYKVYHFDVGEITASKTQKFFFRKETQRQIRDSQRFIKNYRKPDHCVEQLVRRGEKQSN